MAKKKKKKKIGLVKAADESLEGFVDWTDPTISVSAEEKETEMRKLAANTQEEAAPGFEGLDEKRSRQSNFEEDNHKSPKVIVVDSPKRAPD